MNKCIICNSNKQSFVMTKDEWNIWECNNCQLQYVNPQPTNKQIKHLYSLKGGYSHSDKEFRMSESYNKPNKIIQMLILEKKMKVLDVGCSSGGFVFHADKCGLNVIGIDLDKDSIKFGKKLGLDLRNGEIQDINFKDGMFDAINVTDIIEHVKNPILFMKECNRILKNDGIIIMTTPNLNSKFPKYTRMLYNNFNINWSFPTPPYHLFDFNDKNIEILLKMTGFKILKMEYKKPSLFYAIYHTGYFNNIRQNMKSVSYYQIFKSIIKNVKPKMFKQIYVIFLYSIAYWLSMFDNKGDCIHLIIKKYNKGECNGN